MNTFSDDLSLREAYVEDVKRELCKAFAQSDWFGIGYLIQSWTVRCEQGHLAADKLKPLLAHAETQYQLARRGQPWHFTMT